MIRKSVIPVAGLGTRLLPLTKAVPKEMAVGDRPVLEHTIRELADSGIVDITIVTSTRKAVIQSLFAPDRDLECQLEQAGKTELARSPPAVHLGPHHLPLPGRALR
jgi:UTP--glucose-1-phosphate uridylyltransferase